ncbi:MAG: DNA-3-methyladenine glycosylase [Synergistaceae bacterium]|nr:DNA-3-methyladenine glycosylase [Synergistaceae bacterium]MBQ7169160.1 DNA-3-methyladenine glycosylase [Synergistaceae bacterium]
MKKLGRSFYARDTCTVARELIGKILVHDSNEGRTSGIIVETEAYRGPEDKAAHSYVGKRTARTEIMYHEGGLAYVYLIYGMHCCFNVTASVPGKPEAVLIRALEPAEGVDIMLRRRGMSDTRKLCNGPGKLCKAMGITREHYGADLCGDELYVADVGKEFRVGTSERVNIDYAEEWRFVQWRYFAEGNAFVSKR